VRVATLVMIKCSRGPTFFRAPGPHPGPPARQPRWGPRPRRIGLKAVARSRPGAQRLRLLSSAKARDSGGRGWGPGRIEGRLAIATPTRLPRWGPRLLARAAGAQSKAEFEILRLPCATVGELLHPDVEVTPQLIDLVAPHATDGRRELLSVVVGNPFEHGVERS